MSDSFKLIILVCLCFIGLFIYLDIERLEAIILANQNKIERQDQIINHLMTQHYLGR